MQLLQCNLWYGDSAVTSLRAMLFVHVGSNTSNRILQFLTEGADSHNIMAVNAIASHLMLLKLNTQL